MLIITMTTAAITNKKLMKLLSLQFSACYVAHSHVKAAAETHSSGVLPSVNRSLFPGLQVASLAFTTCFVAIRQLEPLQQQETFMMRLPGCIPATNVSYEPPIHPQQRPVRPQAIASKQAPMFRLCGLWVLGLLLGDHSQPMTM